MAQYLALDHTVVAAIEREAAEWLGTPFADHGRAKGKGGGVDCINLMQEIFARALGAGRIAFPRYTLSENLHTSDPRLERELDNHPRLVKLASFDEDVPRKARCLDDLPLMVGDLIGMRVVNVVHHLALSLGGRKFIHCVRGIGTIQSYTDDATFERRIMVVYRPTE